MCGRFTMTVDPAQLQDTFPWLNVPEGMEPRYNIAPLSLSLSFPIMTKIGLSFLTGG
jgi:putative SOS response-associated peptidase YedK